MSFSWKVLAVGVLALGRASAAEATDVQDPPGQVDVDQPAGVSLPERNTERDTTDTRRGGGRTEVIDGERPGARGSGPDIRASETHGNVQAGSEARASFEGGTGSAAPVADEAASDAAPDDADSSTVLGADAGGYGMGTEPAPAR